MRPAATVLLAVLLLSVAQAAPLQVSEDAAVSVDAGSEQSSPALEQSQVANLYLLGKVWGFLKYHHPAVTDGCLEWDGQLLDRMAEVIAAPDEAAVRTLLANWISSLPGRACLGDDEPPVQAHADIGWLEDQGLLGLELGVQLRSIETRPASTNPQHFVSRFGGQPALEFRNERDDASLEDPRARLLALFRLWNAIEYWHAYRHLIPDDWDQALLENVPLFYSAASDQQFRSALLRLLALVDDGQVRLDGVEPGLVAGGALPPFEIRPVQQQAFVAGPLALVEGAGIDYAPGECLASGDIVVEVDGQSVDEKLAPWRPFFPASGAGVENALFALLLRGDENLVTVTVERAGVREQVECLRMPRQSIAGTTTPAHVRGGVTLQLLNNQLAYLKLSSIDPERLSNYVGAAAGAGNIVIDARGVGDHAQTLPPHFVPDDVSYAALTSADLTRPGTLLWRDTLQTIAVTPAFDGRVAVLIDELTAGPTELAVMALQTRPDLIVVGTPSAGQVGGTSWLPLPGGLKAAITTWGVYYPDRGRVQKSGIRPDVLVAPTIDGLLAGRDEVLERAIHELLPGELTDEQVRELAAR